MWNTLKARYGVFNYPCGCHVLDRKINIGIYSLAVLPVDYLEKLGDPLKRACSNKTVDSAYRGVFATGIRAYQLVIYLKLVREHYGRGVANQIGNYQRRLLTAQADNDILHAIDLIQGALASDAVSAKTGRGVIDIPIEMNLAIALLLGLSGSPNYAAHQDLRPAQIESMNAEIDWSLSQCLGRAREHAQEIFSPLLACIDTGERVDFVQAWLNGKRTAS